MSNETNIPNEDELWDLLSEPVKTGAEAKAEAKAAKPDPKPEVKPEPEPVSEPADEPAPAVPEAPVSETAPKAARKIDGFFMACMAGVAAVSVAVTLLVSGMMGGGNSAPAGSGNVSAGSNETVSSEVEALRQENAELKAQLDLQKQQVLELQTSLMEIMGSEQYLATATTDPEGGNEILDAQVEAYDILAQIQEAYANFDREKLEELIPEMDARLQYLSSDALNTYYLILEYVEQPSNG